MKSKEEMERRFVENLTEGWFVCFGISCRECPFWNNTAQLGDKCTKFAYGATPITLDELKPQNT